MTMLVGVFQTLLSILAVSGLTKVARPAQAGAALSAARLVPGPLSRRYKASHFLGRLLGLTEVTLAVAGFAVPLWMATNLTALTTVTALGVAATFVGFNWFIARLTSIDPNASCGCFGDTSAPPGTMHQAFNWVAAFAATATAVAVAITGQLPTASTEGVGQTLLYVAVIAIGSALFLRGPALAAEVQAAVALDEHNHSHAPTFAISQDLLSQNGPTKGRNARGKQS